MRLNRRQLGFVTFGLLAALLVLVALVPIDGAAGIALFAVVVALVAIVFFRFAPWGDTWDAAEKLGVNPWLFAGFVLVVGLLFLAFRAGLFGAA